MTHNHIPSMGDEELQDFIALAKAELANRIEGKREQVISEMHRLAESIGVQIRVFDETSKPDGNGAAKRAPVKVKYRDGANTWSGRGRPPRWLQAHVTAGRVFDEFAV